MGESGEGESSELVGLDDDGARGLEKMGRLGDLGRGIEASKG